VHILSITETVKEIYVSLNHDLLPPKPMFPAAVNNLDDIFQPHWVETATCWMAFVSRWPNFSGDLLGCLHYLSVNEVPLQKYTPAPDLGLQRIVWGMDEALKRKWEFLEEVIAFLRTSIMKECLLCLDIVTPWLSSAWKYEERHESQHKAKAAINRSQKSFVLNMAFLLYMICLRSLWLQKLDKEVGGALAANIRNSWIVDPNAAGRVGAFVDAEGPYGNAAWLGNLEKIQKWSCVPLWICYGRDGPHRPWCHIKVANMLPLPAEVREVAGRVYDASAPVPEKGSGQLQGETPLDYLRRREKELKKEVEGSITAQEARDRQLQRMKDHPLPSKAGPAVWLWEEQSRVNAIWECWIQRPLSWKDVRWYWEKALTKQRVYNWGKHQWDIWERLDPDHVWIEDGEDEEGYSDFNECQFEAA
jgi:hypothetical protein